MYYISKFNLIYNLKFSCITHLYFVKYIFFMDETVFEIELLKKNYYEGDFGFFL